MRQRRQRSVSEVNTHLTSISRLSSSLMTSARHTAVVEKYRSEDTVRVYLRATVYVAAIRVMTVRQ